MVEIGCVHGRFQPFHKDHLQYVLSAKERCKFLWIGITKYNRRQCLDENSTSNHREDLDANPYTYSQRLLMIKQSLISNGIDRSEFEFIPFPIENPSMLCEFIEPSTICFTTVREKWNLKKINLLKKSGYKVEVLWEDYSEKIFSGSKIRPLILEGDTSWRSMVPPDVANIIEYIELNRPNN